MIRLKLVMQLVCLLFVATSSFGQAKKTYTNIPVLLYVSADNQPDTMGFNLAVQLPEVVYALILQERLILWDSPKKTIQITADALQAIEKNTESSFMKSKSIFFNELWTTSKKRSSFQIVGFSFMNTGSKGKVSYGFIDFKELAPLIANELVKTNQNGAAQVSLLEALFSRRYIYTILQFGNQNLKDNFAASIQIMDNMNAPHKKQLNTFSLPETKEIVYSILRNPAQKDGGGELIFSWFEELFKQNKELLYELGGDKYFNFISYNSELAVTRIEIEEIWKKRGDEIVFLPKSITVYVNNKKLSPISIHMTNRLNLNIGLKNLEDIFMEKAFLFELVRINRTYITQEESPLYISALREFSWTQLSRYVKFSEKKLNN